MSAFDVTSLVVNNFGWTVQVVVVAIAKWSNVKFIYIFCGVEKQLDKNNISINIKTILIHVNIGKEIEKRQSVSLVNVTETQFPHKDIKTCHF